MCIIFQEVVLAIERIEKPPKVDTGVITLTDQKSLIAFAVKNSSSKQLLQKASKSIKRVTRLRHELDRFCIFCLNIFDSREILVDGHCNVPTCEKRFRINTAATICPDCNHTFSSCHHLVRHLTYGLCLQANTMMGLRLTDVTSPIINGRTTRDNRYFIWRNAVLGILPGSEYFYLPGGKVISIDRVHSLFREHAETAFLNLHHFTVNDQGAVQFKPGIAHKR